MERELIRTPSEYANWQAALDRAHPRLRYERFGVTFNTPPEYPCYVYFCVYENHHQEPELDYWLEPVLPAISKEVRYTLMTNPVVAELTQRLLLHLLEAPLPAEDMLAVLDHKLYLYRQQEAKKQS